MVRRIAAFAIALFMMSAAGAGDAPSLPDSLGNARAGQWVVYRVNTLFGAADQKQTIVSIEGEGDDRVLTIRSEMSIDGELVDERTDSVTYAQAVREQEEALAGAENIRIGSDTIDFRGVPMDAARVDFVQDGNDCVLYLSEKVPLAGMIRMTVGGLDEPAMELLDFGE